MNKRQQEKFLTEMNAMIATAIQDHLSVPQPAPHVNDLWSGIVALARSSGIDGRLGPGDILVSLALPGVGVAIGGVGAGVQWLTGTPWEQAGFFLEACTLSGCALGILRLGFDGLFVYVLDWMHDTLVDTVVAWRGRDGEIDEDEPGPRTMRQIPFSSQKGATGLSIDVGPALVWTLQIPSKNLKDGWRDIPWDDVRTFVFAACATGNWTRDSQTVLKQKVHADLKRYLEDSDKVENWPIPMWGFTDPPTRTVALEILRNKLTNGTERTGPNGGTG
jgi:hypothetical protein